jgi:Transposase DDE domain
MSQYCVRNWSEYNKGLKQRGSLTFWMSPEVIATWEVQGKTGKSWSTATYSNQAIVTMVS